MCQKLILVIVDWCCSLQEKAPMQKPTVQSTRTLRSARQAVGTAETTLRSTRQTAKEKGMSLQSYTFFNIRIVLNLIWVFFYSVKSSSMCINVKLYLLFLKKIHVKDREVEKMVDTFFSFSRRLQIQGSCSTSPSFSTT